MNKGSQEFQQMNQKNTVNAVRIAQNTVFSRSQRFPWLKILHYPSYLSYIFATCYIKYFFKNFHYSP